MVFQLLKLLLGVPSPNPPPPTPHSTVIESLSHASISGDPPPPPFVPQGPHPSG